MLMAEGRSRSDWNLLSHLMWWMHANNPHATSKVYAWQLNPWLVANAKGPPESYLRAVEERENGSQLKED